MKPRKISEEAKSWIFAITLTLIIVSISAGSYYIFKWTGEDLEELKTHCPDGTKLTDYTFGNSFHKGSQTFQIECDNKVMDYKVEVNQYWECQEYNKWDLCKWQVEKYNSTKLFAKEDNGNE